MDEKRNASKNDLSPEMEEMNQDIKIKIEELRASILLTNPIYDAIR